MQSTSSMTSKGQILIPAWLRKQLGLKPGMRFSFSQKGTDLILHPQTSDYFMQFAGMLGEDDKSVKILLEERRKDNLKENAQFKAMGGIVYADCFAAALAAKENASPLTGDQEFKKLEEVGLVKVNWI